MKNILSSKKNIIAIGNNYQLMIFPSNSEYVFMNAMIDWLEYEA